MSHHRDFDKKVTKPDVAETICLATVEPRSTKWLWFGRLPVGEMVVLTGPPGVGKGLLLCYIVAHYTTGKPMHGQQVAAPAGNVVWISIEDALDSALAPRLEAAGADRARVHGWNMDQPLALPADTDRIVAEVNRHGCGIVIIDPAPTLLDREHSSNNDADVRRSFSTLAAACRKCDCTLVLVRHTNKRTLGSAMDRGGGSIGWSGMARIELMLGRRPLEEGATAADVHESVVTLAPVKSNLGKWPPSLNLRIVEAGECARIEVVGETDTTADDLCSPARPRTASKGDEASTHLRTALADGQWHRQREIEDGAKKAGISSRTLRRARDGLDVACRQKEGVWWWRLAPVGGQVAAWPSGHLETSDRDDLQLSGGQAATNLAPGSGGQVADDNEGGAL